MENNFKRYHVTPVEKPFKVYNIAKPTSIELLGEFRTQNIAAAYANGRKARGTLVKEEVFPIVVKGEILKCK